jgi:hypothetical protein
VLLLFRAVGLQLLSIRHNITKHLYCLSSSTFMCAYNLYNSVSFEYAGIVEAAVKTVSAPNSVVSRRRAIRSCGSRARPKRSTLVKYRFIGCSHIFIHRHVYRHHTKYPTAHALQHMYIGRQVIGNGYYFVVLYFLAYSAISRCCCHVCYSLDR